MNPSSGQGGTASLAIDFVAPVVIYYGLRGAGVGLYPAVLAAAVAPGIGAVISLIRSQRIGPLAALSLSGLAVAVAMSLVGGGTRLLLAKEGWVTAITGGWFLASTGSSRPLAMVLTQPLLQGRWGFSADWDEIWQREPRFRRIWRTSSVLWGLGTLADSAARVLIAYTLPVDVVPAVGTALYVATSVLLIAVTNMYYAWAGLWPMLRAPAPTTGAGAPAPLHVTAKQRVVLGALRDAQHEHDGQAVGAYEIAAVCPAPWHRRPDLVTQALVLLERDGLVLVAAGSTRAWKITTAGRLMLAPRRGPARERPVIGGAPHPR